jgi:molybdate transport system ATP-binding protein
VGEGLDVDVRLRIGRLALALVWRTEARAVALVGPSGCGKSTTLRVLAGLERRATGHVRFGGTTWQEAGRTFVPPHLRRVGWVPQDACLFPHLTVAGNLGYAGAPESEVRGMAERLGIGPLLERRPRHLSGGERQRVALGRALLARPRLLLLDEPFAALDDSLRARLAEEVAALARERELTLVVVSHHALDVVTLAEERWTLVEGELRRC